MNMASITPKGCKNYGYRVHLAANTPGHPNHEEAKGRLAVAGLTPKPVEKAIASASVPTDSTNLKRFDRDGIELVIDTCTGEAFATQSGYARMSGKHRSTIVKRCKGCESGRVANHEVQTAGGLQGCELIPADLVYDWLLNDKLELARAMGKAGATVYMHQLAGFKVSSTATEPIVKPKPEPTAPPIPQLPGDIRLVQMVSTLKDLDFELLNPRFKQGLQDLAADMLGISQPRLEAEKTTNRDGVWFGVVERAEQLGYPVGLLIKKRTSLGRWVAGRITDSVKETRLCNGTQRPINVYRVTDELDRAIVSYFDKLNVKL